MNYELQELAQRAGITFPPEVRGIAKDGIAADAQIAPITTPNSGIPTFLTTWVSPRVIEVATARMAAAEIVGSEVIQGDWTDTSLEFPLVESTGKTAAYGDKNTNGRVGVNIAWPGRQTFSTQVMSEWGVRELDRAGKGKIDLANRISIASTSTLAQWLNKSYFYGISGLKIRGLLNDSDLPNAIVPLDKGSDDKWTAATAQQIFDDVMALYADLTTRNKGIINMDSEFTLALSNTREPQLGKTSAYMNFSVKDTLQRTFKNLTIVTAPQYTTDSGELLQLIAKNVNGEPTAECVFTHKRRAFPIVNFGTWYEQKLSSGTAGTVIYHPTYISSMLGI